MGIHTSVVLNPDAYTINQKLGIKTVPSLQRIKGKQCYKYMSCSCGLPSREECQELFYASSIKEYADFQYAKIHRLKVDAYCLQHPEIYMVSAKSFAAHLVGMCIAMEYNNDQHLMRALQKWLNGKRELEKPPMLPHFGSITIADVMKAKSAPEYKRFVMDWAKCVWSAYAPYHQLAKEWVKLVREFNANRL